ncbi:MAG: hypothetical protein AB7S26_14100 [Sandaracinaceae bacterium]
MPWLAAWFEVYRAYGACDSDEDCEAAHRCEVATRCVEDPPRRSRRATLRAIIRPLPSSSCGCRTVGTGTDGWPATWMVLLAIGSMLARKVDESARRRGDG